MGLGNQNKNLTAKWDFYFGYGTELEPKRSITCAISEGFCYIKPVKYSKVLLGIIVAMLVVGIGVSARGITFVGEPQTWAYQYGWLSLGCLITVTVIIAILFRQSHKRLSAWVLLLAMILLVENILITNIFSY